ncbi:MAG: preprotein translocase subunit YajC [Bifidobacteriaceae bacterium]|nr:preprotein translocase subunit YajC [Bifidobacteriaceae bacterium]
MSLLANDGDEQTAAGGGGFGSYGMLIFIAAMVALMWFMSRRNKKQQQQQGDFRRTLDVGQRVMTVGGMVGVISQVQGDVVTIMSPGGDESAYLRRAIKSQVSDEEWENLTAPYPVDEDETAGEVEPDEHAVTDDDALADGADQGEADDDAEAGDGEEEPDDKDN